MEQLLPQPGDDIEANAATVLSQIAERANTVIAGFRSYVDKAFRGDGLAGSDDGSAALPETRP